MLFSFQSSSNIAWVFVRGKRVNVEVLAPSVRLSCLTAFGAGLKTSRSLAQSEMLDHMAKPTTSQSARRILVLHFGLETC